MIVIFFFKQKTAYEMLISDWSSDVCSSDLIRWSPLELSFTENKFVVAGYFDDTLGKKTGLQPGDVIERINGKKTEEIIKKRLPFTPGSNYIARMRNLALHLLRTNESILKIDYSRGEANHRANLPTYLSDVVFDNYSSYPRATCFKILRPEIA